MSDENNSNLIPHGSRSANKINRNVQEKSILERRAKLQPPDREKINKRLDAIRQRLGRASDQKEQLQSELRQKISELEKSKAVKTQAIEPNTPISQEEQRINKQQQQLVEDKPAEDATLYQKATSYVRLVDEETREKRFSICKSCDKFNKGTKTCQVCGCFMPAKTKFARASCPINKWEKIVVYK